VPEQFLHDCSFGNAQHTGGGNVDPGLMWMLVAVVVVVIAGVAWYGLSRRRTAQLKKRFGSEYDRTVQTEGNVRKAEAALAARARHVAHLNIRPLSAEDAMRFSDVWRRIQARFVDDPQGAVAEADRVVGEVMNARGYPVGNFEQRVADISVDHPDVVMNYRATREIAAVHARGQATTEDLRQAMVHYRALFTDLLQTGTSADHNVREHTAARSR
jgi:hypothetical protein